MRTPRPIRVSIVDELRSTARTARTTEHGGDSGEKRDAIEPEARGEAGGRRRLEHQRRRLTRVDRGAHRVDDGMRPRHRWVIPHPRPATIASATVRDMARDRWPREDERRRRTESTTVRPGSSASRRAPRPSSPAASSRRSSCATRSSPLIRSSDGSSPARSSPCSSTRSSTSLQRYLPRALSIVVVIVHDGRRRRSASSPESRASCSTRSTISSGPPRGPPAGWRTATTGPPTSTSRRVSPTSSSGSTSRCAARRSAARSGRLPTFLVTGVLMLFLLGFGRRYVLGLLGLFDDLERRQTVRRVVVHRRPTRPRLHPVDDRPFAGQRVDRRRGLLAARSPGPGQPRRRGRPDDGDPADRRRRRWRTGAAAGVRLEQLDRRRDMLVLLVTLAGGRDAHRPTVGRLGVRFASGRRWPSSSRSSPSICTASARRCAPFALAVIALAALDVYGASRDEELIGSTA